MNKSALAHSRDWIKRHPKSEEFNGLNLVEISRRKDLNVGLLNEINPRYIFFLHWSWAVESEIFRRYECVVFHTAPLPYGRGASPIQNLILRGIKKAPVCAIKMTEEIDGRLVYKKKEYR